MIAIWKMYHSQSRFYMEKIPPPAISYRDVITGKSQAFCHLLLFFSLYEDETFKGEETHEVFAALQKYAFTADVDFAGEVNVFFDYKEGIGDEHTYFEYLTGLIACEAPNVILFHAAQVALSDAVYSHNDKRCLDILRKVLLIGEMEGNAILQLASGQRMLIIKETF